MTIITATRVSAPTTANTLTAAIAVGTAVAIELAQRTIYLLQNLVYSSSGDATRWFAEGVVRTIPYLLVAAAVLLLVAPITRELGLLRAMRNALIAGGAGTIALSVAGLVVALLDAFGLRGYATDGGDFLFDWLLIPAGVGLGLTLSLGLGTVLAWLRVTRSQ